MVYEAKYYIHDTDKAALKALKAIPGFPQFIKGFMKIWSERQFKVSNLSSCVRMSDGQLSKYYDMLPPICEKLGIDVPELYLQLDVTPNAYTFGDTKPFIIITSGMFETVPEELIPTVLAHECGHIACHHTLYTTIGSLLLNGANSAIRRYVPYSGLVTIPLEMSFFYWMRCSELSADRAAVLCDGSAERMSEVCMRLAGFDKDIDAVASKDAFMQQAKEYREMIKGSKWDKTLEFVTLSSKTHPLMTVRALECEEWAASEQYMDILSGKVVREEAEDISTLTLLENPENPEDVPEKKNKPKFEIPLFKKKEKESKSDNDESSGSKSIPDEIREYKALLDDGIITEEEFDAKKKQLLDL